MNRSTALLHETIHASNILRDLKSYVTRRVLRLRQRFFAKTSPIVYCTPTPREAPNLESCFSLFFVTPLGHARYW